MALAPSSPRLPSPPPPAEIQFGPVSPSATGASAASPQPTQMEQNLVDANAKRRIHPGTRAMDMNPGPPVVPLEKLESPFQLQEHLAALHNHATAAGTQPITRHAAALLASVPDGIDRTLWLYELCRFLIAHCNTLIVGFLFDTPPCSATTCPEMRASEWQFLCAVHETPKSCCAIDYCCHTLDWAANVVTDQKLFPSRFMVANDPSNKNTGLRNLVNVFRRLHRIFAHAWFQHRDIFWAVEGQSGLYVFFKAVCDTYDLLPAENYKLPPEAEGLEAPPSAATASETPERPTPVILKNDTQSQSGGAGAGARNSALGPEDSSPPAPSRTNTRRHIRASPSTGSAVTTVMETEEEESNSVAKRIKELSLSGPELVEEEPDSADVPMMVDHSGELPSAAQPSAGDDDTSSEADQTVVDFADDPEEMPTTTVAPTVQVETTEEEDPSQSTEPAEPVSAPAGTAEEGEEPFTDEKDPTNASPSGATADLGDSKETGDGKETNDTEETDDSKETDDSTETDDTKETSGPAEENQKTDPAADADTPDAAPQVHGKVPDDDDAKDVTGAGSEESKPTETQPETEEETTQENKEGATEGEKEKT